jgi:hypothetical protein
VFGIRGLQGQTGGENEGDVAFGIGLRGCGEYPLGNSELASMLGAEVVLNTAIRSIANIAAVAFPVGVISDR